MMVLCKIGCLLPLLDHHTPINTRSSIQCRGGRKENSAETKRHTKTLQTHKTLHKQNRGKDTQKLYRNRKKHHEDGHTYLASQKHQPAPRKARLHCRHLPSKPRHLQWYNVQSHLILKLLIIAYS